MRRVPLRKFPQEPAGICAPIEGKSSLASPGEALVWHQLQLCLWVLAYAVTTNGTRLVTVSFLVKFTGSIVHCCETESSCVTKTPEVPSQELRRWRMSSPHPDRCQDSSRLNGEVGRMVSRKRAQMRMENRSPVIEPSFRPQSSVRCL